VAIQAGHHAARMILNSRRGKPRFPFKYLDKGRMATIGERKAVARIGNFKLSGYLAWLGWLFVHVLYLIGFKNKIAVLLQWAWSYLFSRRGSRLITEREWKLEK
jgi:NADH dehydrogenase